MKPKSYDADPILWTPCSDANIDGIATFGPGAPVVYMIPCPECDGAGMVTEYISRTDYIATGGSDPVECAECKGSGWVEADPE